MRKVGNNEIKVLADHDFLTSYFNVGFKIMSKLKMRVEKRSA